MKFWKYQKKPTINKVRKHNLSIQLISYVQVYIHFSDMKIVTFKYGTTIIFDIFLVKKAYHQLSLLVHPDRVEEDIKAEATEKFKVLGRIYSILSDNEKRKIYDQSGQYDEESEEVMMRNWADYWKSLFKKISVEDINNYEKNYKGSEIEIKDLKRAYMDSK